MGPLLGMIQECACEGSMDSLRRWGVGVGMPRKKRGGAHLYVRTMKGKVSAVAGHTPEVVERG